MKLLRKIRNIIRKPIVKHRIKSGRYLPVKNGINAYYDMKRGVVVNGYYDKPFSYTSELIKFE